MSPPSGVPACSQQSGSANHRPALNAVLVRPCATVTTGNCEIYIECTPRSTHQRWRPRTRIQLSSLAATDRVLHTSIVQTISLTPPLDTSIQKRKSVIEAKPPTEANHSHHKSRAPKQHGIKEWQTENIQATRPRPSPLEPRGPFKTTNAKPSRNWNNCCGILK